MPHLTRITLYPVKSLPGVEVTKALLTARGALRHDREYALVDRNQHFISGKARAAIHALDAACALAGDSVCVTLGAGAAGQAFRLDHADDRTRLCERLTRYFGEPVSIERDGAGGFPDDPDAPGPTVLAEASFVEVARWFPGLTAHDMRLRFRANLEFSDCPAFWEDQLFGAKNERVAFQVGAVRFLGVNPCQRCVVPTRDASSGETWPGFQRTFVQRRHETLPTWAPRSRFDFCYRLAVNTTVDATQSDKTIHLGDDVRLITDAQSPAVSWRA